MEANIVKAEILDGVQKIRVKLYAYLYIYTYLLDCDDGG